MQEAPMLEILFPLNRVDGVGAPSRSLDWATTASPNQCYLLRDRYVCAPHYGATRGYGV